MKHRPAHARILGRDGHNSTPVTAPLCTKQLHELLHSGVGLGNAGNVLVVLRNAFVQAAHFTEQVTHNSIGPARQIFEVLQRLAANDSRLQRNNNTEF